MRKTFAFAIAALALVLAGTTAMFYSRYQKSEAAFLEMKAAEQSASDRYARTIESIAEIQDSLNAIAIGSTVDLQSGDLRGEQNLAGASGQQALDRIALLRSSIQRNKQRITQLESALSKSGTKAAGMQKLIANLKSSVAEKEAHIAMLAGRVDTLTTQVASLETTVQQKEETVRAHEQTLEDRRRELATVFVAVGTKKDLTTSGVIAAQGGVLGMGKTLKPTGSLNASVFHPLDTDQETVVRVGTLKAQVVSAQPPTSYELKPVDGQLELRILDPKEFRKVKQLIIVTA